MAQDWIKVCKETIDKPEIALLSEAIGATIEEAFGWWFRLYCWLDANSADGKLRGMTLKRLALLARVPESVTIGLASDSVRWLIAGESKADHSPSVTVANWERHNGKSAKQRAQTARRVEVFRDRKKAKPRPKQLTTVG